MPPRSEAARLAAVEATGLLDTPPEQDFEDIAQLLARVFETPIALVTLVDSDRLWFKAAVGLAEHEVPRATSFCTHAVAAGKSLIVPDTTKDPRFVNNPWVTGDAHIRFYAGTPLLDASGQAIGTLCAIDRRPRQPGRELIEILTSLGRQVQTQIELRNRVRDMERMERQHDTFFDLSIDMLAITDRRGYFTDINPHWTRVLGWSAEELKSRPAIEFVHPDDRERTLKEVERQRRGPHETRGFVNRYRCRDGSYRWLSWNAALEPHGQLVHAVARDVTERRQAEALKQEFVSMVSHELRTPLTSILGSLRLLQVGVGITSDPKGSELLRIADANAKRLLSLVNDILDLEKYEAGKMDVRTLPVDAAVLLRRAKDAVQSMATESEVCLDLAHGSGRATVLADADRLEQVLTNLLSNAIKFSHEGGTVTLNASVRGAMLRFEVADQGPGIPQAELPKLFERFQQLDSSDVRRKGGTGLGLAIAKKIVEAHGGTIGAESTPGSGSRFWFEIPTAP